jgi:hypothetical protein
MKRFAFIAALVLLLIALAPLLRARAANAAAAAEQVAPQPPLPGNARPLVSGEFVSGTLWEKPVGSTGLNSGYSPAAGSRVDVYDNFIIVTDTVGVSEVSEHGSYTKLRFKPYHP